MDAKIPSEEQGMIKRTLDYSDEALGGRDGRRELLGAIIFLCGVFLLACVIFGGGGDQHIGTFGEFVYSVVTNTFGQIVSCIFPVGVMALGGGLFFGKSIKWSYPKFAGLLLVLIAFCGLLAIPGANNIDKKQATLELAGVVGVFLTHYEGGQMVYRMGHIGASLTLIGAMVVGIVLMTGLSLSSIFSLLSFRSNRVEEEVDISEMPTPVPLNVGKSKKKKAEPETLVQVQKSDSEPLYPNVPSVKQPGFFSRSFHAVTDWTASLFSSKPERHERPSILSPIDDDAFGWSDGGDEDVAAAARALEVHELESRLQRRLRVRSDQPYFDDEEEDEIGISTDENYESDQTYADSDTEDYEVEGELENRESDELEDEEDEIIFQDNSKPLKNSADVGGALAKMFPNRWPKQGQYKSAEEQMDEQHGHFVLDETPDEVFDKSEARMLRRTEGSEQFEGEEIDGDPLFTAKFDTRPHGPNGEEYGERHHSEIPKAPNIYHLPSLELLSDPPDVDSAMTREEVIELSALLVKTIADYGIEGKVIQVHQGPVVTRFEFRPAAGTKVSRIVGLEQDIAMGMKALSVRILAPIPGKNVVGIEVPNKVRQGVYVKELFSCEDFWDAKSTLEVAIGKTIDGKPYFADLAKMPHLLIAGATGAGKSVCLNTIICSLLYRQPPNKVKLIMVDPKRVELSVYGDIPHLLAPVVCEPKRAAAALEWAVEQMEDRYKKLVEFGVRNIDGYNKLCANPESNKKSIGRSLEPMPYMVIIVDELADLMIVAKAEVEESIQRLAQMARAVGIHLILATQRPSVNVITGIIKANFPTRVAFQVSQKVDSRTILDSNGAEALLGKGDMLFSKGGADKPIRIQGAFLSDDEVEQIAEHCRVQQPVIYEVEEFEPKLSEKEQKELARMMGVDNMDDLNMQDRMVNGTNKPMGKVSQGMFIPHEGGSASAGDDEIDEALVRAAARLILESRKASVSLLQRRLKVGFARAGRLMDMLEDMGIVGEFVGSKPRDIIVDPEAALEQLDNLENALARGVSVDQIKNAEEDEEYDEDYN